MTTYSATFSTPGTSAVIELRLDVTLVSQNNSANTSLLSWSLYMVETVNASPYRLTANSSASAIVGSTVFSSGSLAYDFRASLATVPIASGSTTITHGSDGTKSITIAASYTDGGAIIGNASFSTTLVLPQIPRNRVKAGVAGVWRLSETYVGINGAWVPAKLYVGAGGVWKEVSPT